MVKPTDRFDEDLGGEDGAEGANSASLDRKEGWPITPGPDRVSPALDANGEPQQAAPSHDVARPCEVKATSGDIWTKRYPKEHRAFLSYAGVDPNSYPRAHEMNLRLLEVMHAFDIAMRYFDRTHADDHALQALLWHTIGATAKRVDVFGTSFAAFSKAAMTGETIQPAPARPDDEVEIGDDWLSRYPQEYERLLTEWGVPTVPGTQADDFNRALIEAVDPNCREEWILEEAAWHAVVAAFGENAMDRQDQDDEKAGILVETDDEYLFEYPQQFRGVLSRFGRPDYEHQNAPLFNRALIASFVFLRERRASEEDLGELRGLLWSAFFGSAPS